MQLKNGKALHISQACKADAAELIVYCNQVGGESDNLTYGANEFNMTLAQEEQYLENLSSATTSALLVGTVGGNIICAGSINGHQRQRTAHKGSLGITVLKSHWGLGAGTHMMNALIAFAKSTDKLELIYLEVRADHQHAITLYKKMGFHEIGRFPHDTKINGQYFDAILMVLHL